MEGDLVVNRRVSVPAAQLHERFSRASGPGGQGVNTTDSRVELSFDVARSSAVPEDLREQVLERLAGRLVDGVLTVVASEHRAQLRNRAAAAQRMRELLAAACAPPPPRRRATKATKGSQRRRLAGKRQRGETKRLRHSTDD
ncbi:MAG: alternative ribosome rescue aminoacyl-tRNA hydrolase ArfB [Janthinobacterium lividum]